ncbi:MAG: phosphoglucomutase/phosphomannomutase family protein [Chitinophagales bacterium]
MKIKFGTDGWRAIIAKEYTVDNVARVAYATAKWLKSEYANPSVVMGYDCRFGGIMFAETAAKVLCDAGVKVNFDPNFAATPMVSLACVKLKCNAGVVITASHNPPTYNGFKLKSHFGGPTIPSEIAKVEAIIPDQVDIPTKSLDEYEAEGLLVKVNLEKLYFDHVEANFDTELIRRSGLVVAYDAMYGAGRKVVKKLLPDVIALHCDANPGFNGQAPEPLDRNLQELAELIKNSTDINFGFANDGDADRIGVYDELGNFIDSHHVIVLLIYYLIKFKGYSGKAVVSFSVTSRIKKICEHFGINYEVTKIGFKYICEIMINEDVLLGAEESGGIAVKGHIPERDGIWTALLLLEFMAKTGKKLTELIDEVYEITGPFSFHRDDLHISEALKQEIIANCEAGKYTSFGQYTVKEAETIDGYKFHLDDDSWVMIRPSGTEPVLRVYSESSSMEKVKSILSATHQALSK